MKWLSFLLAVLLPTAVLADQKKSDADIEAALSSPERLLSIGNHARAASDLMLAMSFYDRALAIDANYVPALRASAEVALQLDLPQALSFAQRWVSREPQNGLAHLAVGAALVQQNRPTEAQRALALAEAAGGPATAIAVQNGLVFDLLGQTKDAQISFARALQLAPNDVAIVQAMALSFAISGDDAAALQVLQPFAERYAQDSEFQRTVVLVHALAGRLDVAQRIANASLPPQASAGAGELLRRVAKLPTVRQKAAAVHLGILPDIAHRAEAPPVAETATPPPAPAMSAVTPPPQQAAAAPPAPAPREMRPAAVKPPPRPAPLPEAMPRLSGAELKQSRIWVQLASTPDRALLVPELATLKRKARGALDDYNAYVQSSGDANRLLVGPFESNADAERVAKRLHSRHIDVLVSRTSAGSDIAPL